MRSGKCRRGSACTLEVPLGRVAFKAVLRNCIKRLHYKAVFYWGECEIGVAVWQGATVTNWGLFMRVSGEVAEIINNAFTMAKSARYDIVTPELALYVICQNQIGRASCRERV